MARTVVLSAALALLAGCATSPVQQAGAGPVGGPGEGRAAVIAVAEVAGSHLQHSAESLPLATEQPSMPAGQLRDGLLHVLEALHTQDMDPALVERSLGVRMGRSEISSRWFAAYGPVDEGWDYAVDLIPPDNDAPYINIYLFPDHLPGNRLVLTQCTLDPHAFANALRQAGWTVRDKPYWYVKAWHLPFKRPIPGTDGGVSGEIRFLYLGEEPDGRRPCMVGMDIYAGKWVSKS
ncbi:hypothetical protein [Pseudoxanthomonas koreensis]|uniref:hypothetical protein n=1 Tax=Pseudoxanthomonas koreensis TaxID=266061 RepID=UPI0035A606E0